MDLNKFDNAFADTPSDSVGSLPDGKYTAKISDTSVFESKDGRAYFKIVFTVTDGEFKGTNVQKLHSLDNPERFKFLKNDLINMGLHLQKLSDLPKAHERSRGIAVSIQAKTKDGYSNIYLNGRATPEAPKDSNVPF